MFTHSNMVQSPPSHGQTAAHWVVPEQGPAQESVLTLADSQAPATAESARTRTPIAIQRMMSRVDDIS